MSSIETTHNEREAATAERLYGVYPAVVKDIRDPENLGRVRIELPATVGVAGAANWARLATLMAGNKRGSWFVPDVNDEVSVAFERGDPGRPYVLGALWSGSEPPPQVMDDAAKNNRKVLRSRNGVTVTLDDQDGAEQMILEAPGGAKITLKNGSGAVVIQDASGNSITLTTSGITVTSSAKVTVTASEVEVSAAQVTVNAGMSAFSGVVKADTVIANSVVAASYSPGAGNIW